MVAKNGALPALIVGSALALGLGGCGSSAAPSAPTSSGGGSHPSPTSSASPTPTGNSTGGALDNGTYTAKTPGGELETIAMTVSASNLTGTVAWQGDPAGDSPGFLTFSGATSGSVVQLQLYNGSSLSGPLESADQFQLEYDQLPNGQPAIGAPTGGEATLTFTKSSSSYPTAAALDSGTYTATTPSGGALTITMSGGSSNLSGTMTWPGDSSGDAPGFESYSGSIFQAVVQLQLDNGISVSGPIKSSDQFQLEYYQTGNGDPEAYGNEVTFTFNRT